MLVYGWLDESNSIVYSMFSGLFASVKQDPNFWPELTRQQVYTLLLGKIAIAIKRPILLFL